MGAVAAAKRGVPPLPPIEPILAQETSIREAMGHVDVARGIRYVLTGKVDHYRWTKREVASTLEEARQTGKDFYHPQFGWLRAGYKKEVDYAELTENTAQMEEEIEGLSAQEVR